MSEEVRKNGEAGTKRIISLFEELGWVLHGSLGFDIPCSLHDRKNPHGVDGYMTYFDPYRGFKRGVIIESKNWAWKNISPSKIESFLEQTLQTLECASEYEKSDPRLYSSNVRTINSAILGIWAKINETNRDNNYDHEKFKEYLQKAPIYTRRREAYKLLVLGNYNLKRLGSLVKTFNEIKKEYEGIQFYHFGFSDNDPVRNSTLTIEEIVSRYVVASSKSGGKTFVFYFDDVKLESLYYMYYALRKYQLTGDEKQINIYHFERNPDRFILEEFKQNGPHKTSGKGPEIYFKHFTRVSSLHFL